MGRGWMGPFECLLVLSLGCSGNAAHIVQPPDEDTVTIVTGPPAYGISTPNTLLLYVGEKQPWPTVTVYDSADNVITDVELGWKFYNLDALRFTYKRTGGFDSVWATAECEGTVYPQAFWRKDYGTMYPLNNRNTAKITITALLEILH